MCKVLTVLATEAPRGRVYGEMPSAHVRDEVVLGIAGLAPYLHCLAPGHL